MYRSAFTGAQNGWSLPFVFSFYVVKHCLFIRHYQFKMKNPSLRRDFSWVGREGWGWASWCPWVLLRCIRLPELMVPDLLSSGTDVRLTPNCLNKAQEWRWLSPDSLSMPFIQFWHNLLETRGIVSEQASLTAWQIDREVFQLHFFSFL